MYLIDMFWGLNLQWYSYLSGCNPQNQDIQSTQSSAAKYDKIRYLLTYDKINYLLTYDKINYLLTYDKIRYFLTYLATQLRLTNH